MSRNAADNVINIYQQHASAFARQRNRDLVEKGWLDAFLHDMPNSGATVLDLGCGNGQPMAAYLIENGCSITGVDGAAAMTERARESFPTHEWITADMRALPKLKRFHGIIAWHSFFHLTAEAQEPMFETFGRLSLPGAVLMFTSGPSRAEAIGTFEGEPLYHASLDSERYQNLLQANGFAVVRHIVEDKTCGGATIWLAKKNLDSMSD